MEVDEEQMTPEQLWEHYMGKYKNPNPIANWFTTGFFRSLERIIQTLPADQRILEVGCGPGESTRRIQGMLRGHYMEASEYEQRLVDMNLSHGFPVTLTQESVYELHRQDNEFDCILLLEVLEHLDDFELALKEICRVASRSIIVSVPNEPLWRILNCLRGKYLGDWGNTPGHINHWSRRQFVQLIGRHARITSVHSPLPWTIVHADVSH